MKKNIFKKLNVLIIIIICAFFLSILLCPLLLTKGKKLSLIFLSKEIRFSIIISFYTSIIAIILAFILALVVAYSLSKKDFIGKKQIEVILILPVVLPPLVLGLSLLILFGPVLGEHLKTIGIDFVYTPLGIIVAQFIIAFPLMVQIFKNAFESIDPSIIEAGIIDGGSELIIFKNIIIPISFSQIISGISLGWARAIGEFGITMMLAGATKFKTETLPIAIFLNISTGELDQAIAVSFILLLISLIFLCLIKSLDKKSYGY